MTRIAVLDASPDLLKQPLNSGWRQYLKLVALNLEVSIQPLVLMKFDEDVKFRRRLQQLIDRELNLEKEESDSFIFYFNKGAPLPKTAITQLEKQYHKITNAFQIALNEKITYCYEADADLVEVYPPADLLAGILTRTAPDFTRTAAYIFYGIAPEFKFMAFPLISIYGEYFENPAAAKSHYQNCLAQIDSNGYISPFMQAHENLDTKNHNSKINKSAFVFTYKLLKKYNAGKVSELITMAKTTPDSLSLALKFAKIFGVTVPEFEKSFARKSSK